MLKSELIYENNDVYPYIKVKREKTSSWLTKHSTEILNLMKCNNDIKPLG